MALFRSPKSMVIELPLFLERPEDSLAWGRQKSDVLTHQRNENCGFYRLNAEILRQLSPETDRATYASLLKHCTIAKTLCVGKRVHEHMSRHGHAGNRFLSNLLVQMYGKCGSLQNARTVFDKIVYRDLYSWNTMIAASAQNGSLDDARALFAEMPQRDVVSWNAMTAAFAQNGHGKEALEVFSQMQAEGFQPNRVTFICVVDACACVAALEEGQVIHAAVAGNGWESDVVVGTALINMYGKCGNIDDARVLFVDLPRRDVVSWNAMIAAFAFNRHGNEALQLFGHVEVENFEPNKITFISILDVCASVAAIEEGRTIHTTLAGKGWELDVVVGTALINMYGTCKKLDDAMAVFTEMPQWNVVCWNAIITACTQNRHDDEALQLLGQMQTEGFEPDRITFIGCVDACASLAALDEGRVIHAIVACNGWELDVVLGTALINMYGRSGIVEDAKALFAKMPWRTVVSWNAIIAACAQNGHDREALQLFGQMQAGGFKPDDITFLSILTACSHTGLVADGTRYFASMNRDHGINPSVEHCVRMVDLLGRRGLLEEAEDLIISMPFEHVLSAWVSLLSSCRIHNDVERAARAANYAFELDPKSSSPYVLLASIHANAGRSNDMLMVRKAVIDSNWGRKL